MHADEGPGGSRATATATAAGSAEVVHDVVIVGAGPVGLLLAVLLRQGGLDVVLLERRPGPSSRTRAIGIHPPSLAVLAEAGLREAVLERALLVSEGRAGADGRVLGRMRFDAGAVVGSIAILPQPETERLLRERLAQLSHSGVGEGRPDAVRFGATVQRLTAVPGGVVVEVAGADATSHRLRARCVVGADGVHSTVRAAAGIGWRRVGGRRRYAMADLLDHHAVPAVAPEDDAGPGPAGAAPGGASTGVAELWFERGGVVESFPMTGGRRWVVLLARGLHAPTIERFAALVRARTGLDPRAALRHPGAGTGAAAGPPPSEFIAEQHLAERFAQGRMLLVGDAAHQVSPIGGQGMNLGWLDVAALAPVLVAALRPRAAAARDGVPGAAPAATPPGVALAVWARARRRAARRAQRRARFNMAMGRPAGAVLHALRCVAIRVLAGGPWRAALGRAFTMRDL